MSREAHVRFWEGAGVKFPRATHLCLSHLCACVLQHSYFRIPVPHPLFAHLDVVRRQRARNTRDLARRRERALPTPQQPGGTLPVEAEVRTRPQSRRPSPTCRGGRIERQSL